MQKGIWDHVPSALGSCSLDAKADEDWVLKPVVTRWTTKFLPPRQDNTCDDCSGSLTQRDDDTKETALKRLETYKSQTQPLIEFYEKKGILECVDGNKDRMETLADIKAII